MYGLSPSDLIAIGCYTAAMLLIGWWSSRRVHSSEDYFLGGRRFGKLLQTFAAFGQATSSDGPVGVATTTFRNGAAGIWSALLMVFCTPLYWITSPWLRRLRVLTMGDFYLQRYGSRRMAATYALLGSIGMMGLLSAGYTAVTKTGIAMTPKAPTELTVTERAEFELAQELSALETRDAATLNEQERTRLQELRAIGPRSVFSQIDADVLIWVICLIVIVYAVMGGLEAAFYTDLIQGVFIVVLSVIMLPFAWRRIAADRGGEGMFDALSILHAELPDSFFEVFGSPMLIDFTWYYVAAAALVAGVTVVTQPNQLVTNAAARDEHSARVGMVTGSFMKRFCTILWGLFGLAAALLYTGTIRESDLVWGYATRDLLGPVDVGLVGLMFVCMMSALMSTADCLMLTVSGLVMNNLYRPCFPDRSDRHYIRIGRIVGVLFLTGGALISTQFDNLLQILKFIWEFFVIFAAAFWLGLKWRRATRVGAWASILVTFALFYLVPTLLPIVRPALRTHPALVQQTAPATMAHSYVARTMDVAAREDDIRRWEERSRLGLATGPRPQELQEGERFTREFVPPSRAIFWSQGVKQGNNGTPSGSGYLYLELLLLDALGFDLAHLPYALNETIRVTVRLVTPFLILIGASLLSRRDDPEMLQRFFVRMRTRVKGHGADQDAEELAAAMANPAQSETTLLFPRSDWEFYRWTRADFWGVVISIGVVFVVLGVLLTAVSAGS